MSTSENKRANDMLFLYGDRLVDHIRLQPWVRRLALLRECVVAFADLGQDLLQPLHELAVRFGEHVTRGGELGQEIRLLGRGGQNIGDQDLELRDQDVRERAGEEVILNVFSHFLRHRPV